MIGCLTMMALAGGEAISKIKAGEEEKKAAYESAAERRAEAAETKRRGLERQQEIARQALAAKGRVRGAAAKSGLRVAGSVTRLEQAVGEQFQRENLETGTQTMFAAGGLEREAGRLRRYGRHARQASVFGAPTGLLKRSYEYNRDVMPYSDWFKWWKKA